MRSLFFIARCGRVEILFKCVSHTGVDITSRRINTLIKTTAVAGLIRHIRFFIKEINEYFISNGIGWKIINEQIETRGDEVFETAVKTVVSVLEKANLQTAKTEIKEALIDLSRRPTPDITGAIQHSLACLECVTREITGDKKSTLGDLMKKFPGVIPSPLDVAVSKIWGFTSGYGQIPGNALAGMPLNIIIVNSSGGIINLAWGIATKSAPATVNNADTKSGNWTYATSSGWVQDSAWI